jgi:hypothetical protein
MIGDERIFDHDLEVCVGIVVGIFVNEVGMR